ncbi:MAG: hypothetical protein ACJ72W_15835 [Actinoallomurus sp.]
MTELPTQGSQGEIWTVHVPVVFDVAAPSWQQAKAIVDQAIGGRVAAAAPSARGQQGIESWSHQRDAFPARNLSQTMRQTFLADLTTIELLRALVDSQAEQPADRRTLTEPELRAARLTLAAADRYIEIPNPEFSEGDPRFAGHASEAADELPKGLYDAKDIAGRDLVLFVGHSRFSATGTAAATLPIGNVDSYAVETIAAVLQSFDRTQQPFTALERVSSIVRGTGHEGLDAHEVLAACGAASRLPTATVAMIDWTDAAGAARPIPAPAAPSRSGA